LGASLPRGEGRGREIGRSGKCRPGSRLRLKARRKHAPVPRRCHTGGAPPHCAPNFFNAILERPTRFRVKGCVGFCEVSQCRNFARWRRSTGTTRTPSVSGPLSLRRVEMWRIWIGGKNVTFTGQICRRSELSCSIRTEVFLVASVGVRAAARNRTVLLTNDDGAPQSVSDFSIMRENFSTTSITLSMRLAANVQSVAKHDNVECRD
jgi:hypothetical protein